MATADASPPDVRLYGRAVGFGSHAQVTTGFASALRSAGMLAGLVAFDRDLPPDSPQPAGAMAPVGVFTGPLGYLPALRRGVSHRARYAMVAPNSSAIPGNLAVALDQLCTEVLVPSPWAKAVVEDWVRSPVRVVPHGIAPEFQLSLPARARAYGAYQQGSFKVLHLSSSDRERKGTRALIEAWGLLVDRGEIPADSTLRLVLDMEAMSKTMAWMAEQTATGRALGNVVLTVRMDASPTELARVYGEHHLVCQPSRGEGFGLCPLEALATGVPIVATRCTGHGAWFRDGLPGAVAVAHGADAPIDDVPGSLAPAVDPEAIAASLRQAYADWPALHAAAMDAASGTGAEWTWERQLASFLAHLQMTTKEIPT